jgi:hypothetical protein
MRRAVTAPITPPSGFAIQCRACGAPIKWLRMPSGKAMPVDAKAVRRAGTAVLWREDGRQALPGADGYTEGHESHFATCPDAARFRRG